MICAITRKTIERQMVHKTPSSPLPAICVSSTDLIIDLFHSLVFPRNIRSPPSVPFFSPRRDLFMCVFRDRRHSCYSPCSISFPIRSQRALPYWHHLFRFQRIRFGSMIDKLAFRFVEIYFHYFRCLRIDFINQSRVIIFDTDHVQEEIPQGNG